MILTETHHVDDKKETFKPKFFWKNALAFTILHLSIIYTVQQAYHRFPLKSFILSILIFFLCENLGVIIACHRMWSHKAFKAKWPLRLFLGFCQTLSGQTSIYEWCRDHRVHHKYADTDADPYNINRGFFFAHIGWMCLEKHPEVKRKGAKIDMSDLDRDWIVRYQKKYYVPLYFLICHILPVYVIMKLCGEPFLLAICHNFFRYLVALHFTWSTNSFAHTIGYRPYDKNLKATEFAVIGNKGFGEWWHNFHHAFPWDYKLLELTQIDLANSHRIIEFFAHIGQAYDLKTVSQDMIKKRVLRTGDGTHPYSKMAKESNIISRDFNGSHLWGWDDIDITENDKNSTDIYNRPKN